MNKTVHVALLTWPNEQFCYCLNFMAVAFFFGSTV